MEVLKSIFFTSVSDGPGSSVARDNPETAKQVVQSDSENHHVDSDLASGATDTEEDDDDDKDEDRTPQQKPRYRNL